MDPRVGSHRGRRRHRRGLPRLVRGRAHLHDHRLRTLRRGNSPLYGDGTQWIDPTPSAPTSGDEYWGNPQAVSFTATFYDGGSAKKGGALKPDWFGMQINGVSGGTLPESAPIQMKGGNVTVA